MLKYILFITIIYNIIPINAVYYTNRQQIKNINKAIDKKCNYEAFKKTENKELFECLTNNLKNNCINITGFKEYNKIRKTCIIDNQIYTISGFLITILLLLIASNIF